MNIMRRVANGCIGLGVMLIVMALAERYYTNYKTQELIADYRTGLEESVYPSQNPSKGKQPEYKEIDAELAPVRWEDHYEEGALLGVLVIPCLDVQVALCEGTSQETLKYAVGHFEGTAFPGQMGNCAIAGHRSYTYGEYFSRLDELKEKDLILIEVQGRTYQYEVTESFIVEPEALEVLEDSDKEQLTLITCTPKYTATHRLIIRAQLINEGMLK